MFPTMVSLRVNKLIVFVFFNLKFKCVRKKNHGVIRNNADIREEVGGKPKCMIACKYTMNDDFD